MGKKGVVRDKQVHKDVIAKVGQFAMDLGFFIQDLGYSPIKGPEGNIEYLLYMKMNGEGSMDAAVEIEKTVEEAHSILNEKT